MILNLKRHNPDGFFILKSITFDLCPHPGRQGPDAQEGVGSFSFNQDETLYDFQSKSIFLLDEPNIICAIPDNTKQINKFTGKYIQHIQSQSDLAIKSIISKHFLQ
eukprot:15355132-Ditylum_brightwellii.AAC.1